MKILIYNALHSSFSKKSSFVDYKEFFDNLALEHFSKFEHWTPLDSFTTFRECTL